MGSENLPLLPRIDEALLELERPRRFAHHFPLDFEQKFDQMRRQNRIDHYRAAVMIAIVLNGLILPAEYFLLPERFAACLAMRLGGVVPLGLILLFAISRVGPKVREFLFAASPVPAWASVLYLYNDSVESIAIGQITFIMVMMFGVVAMRNSVAIICCTVVFSALCDSAFLIANPTLHSLSATMFAYAAWTAAGLSMLVNYRMDRQERVDFLLRMRNESQNVALEASNAELARLTMIDPLTGIPNRRSLDAELSAAWELAIRGNQPLAVLMIDLDHFKRLNDRHGHAYGDAVLCLVAQTIRESLRGEQDTLARFGGEEFIVVLPNRMLASAILVAERICAAVRDVALPPVEDGIEPRMTVSIGAASVFPAPAVKTADLTSTADAALYEAKRLGRDQVRPGRLESG
jgi:diguanylate cyclase (GGDEF)-like protein